MKKITILMITSLVFLLISYQSAKAQLVPCDPDCAPEMTTKNVVIDWTNIRGECPLEICISQEIWCGEPKAQCFQMPTHCEIFNPNTPATAFPFSRLPEGNPECDCEFIMASVTIKRLHSGASGIYSTIVLTGTDAQDFQNVLNGVPGSSANFFGTLDNCDGTEKIKYAFSFLNGQLSAQIVK